MSRETARARYLMYNTPDRSQAWRLDVENDGKIALFWANGKPLRLSPDASARLLNALTDLDTAFGSAMQEDSGFQAREVEFEL